MAIKKQTHRRRHKSDPFTYPSSDEYIPSFRDIAQRAFIHHRVFVTNEDKQKNERCDLKNFRRHSQFINEETGEYTLAQARSLMKDPELFRKFLRNTEAFSEYVLNRDKKFFFSARDFVYKKERRGISEPQSLESAFVVDYSVGKALQDYISERLRYGKDIGGVSFEWRDFPSLVDEVFQTNHFENRVKEHKINAKTFFKEGKERYLISWMRPSEEPFLTFGGFFVLADITSESRYSDINDSTYQKYDFPQKSTEIQVYDGQAKQIHDKLWGRIASHGDFEKMKKGILKSERDLSDLCRQFIPGTAIFEVNYGDVFSGSTILYGEREVDSFSQAIEFFNIGHNHRSMEGVSNISQQFLENLKKKEGSSYGVSKDGQLLLMREQHYLGFLFDYKYILIKKAS